MANKLELTWYGKDKPIVVEPRLLIENAALSNSGGDQDTENMLIHGDNLLVLKALEGKFAGMVKCIYIDPPFNTGQAFENYDDNLEMSIWLDLMRSRLKILHALLREDGTLFVHIDDENLPYITLLLDEIFGKQNRLYLITFKQGAATGHKAINPGCVTTTNFVLIYSKQKGSWKLYAQMMQHFYCKNGFLQEEVVGTREYNLQQTYSWRETVGLFDPFTEDIRNVLFTGIQKGVFSEAKFDSKDGELTLARVMETDSDVINWLRPHPREFNITYNHGHAYEPDFVVETEDIIYLVEVKGEDKLNDPDVIAKKERGIQYCAVASHWGKANGYKEWRYLFIPAGQIRSSSTFTLLAERFKEL